jgi:hypothetical protein
MNRVYRFFGIPLSQAVALFTFMAGVASVWVHLEIRLAEVNVEIVNLKQDMIVHKAANQKDFESLREDLHTNTREILRRIDEIQIYLRKHN